MQSLRHPVFLTRIDPHRNMARFYALSVEPTLFGDYAVQRRWGRLGTSGRSRSDLFPDLVSAHARKAQLVRSKCKRGYVEG
ncbi:WGR domain-containing protein [Roseibium marinum]|uniref:Putative DNA-binding WGR domain protein n=1 Tax=Roseibium marinum TaxID=281252 RepID=A0A2S3UJA2_9HYPH|nr:WGR domain-containing protein [Roseibium marinum]POF27784.1 putative DNA-binding WGR domain protein [Roseibium marinum]